MKESSPNGKKNTKAQHEVSKALRDLNARTLQYIIKDYEKKNKIVPVDWIK